MHPGNETEDLANYAVLDERGVVTNVAWSGPGFAAEMPNWVKVSGIEPEPAKGWSSPDGGKTWKPPGK